MAVPTRPAAGAPIESAWGDIVHDSIAAMDLQAGTASVVVSAAAAGSTVVTFPRPFAAPPVVTTATGPLGTSLWVVTVLAVTATQVTLNATTKTGATGSATVPMMWIAYGTRA